MSVIEIQRAYRIPPFFSIMDIPLKGSREILPQKVEIGSANQKFPFTPISLLMHYLLLSKTIEAIIPQEYVDLVGKKNGDCSRWKEKLAYPLLFWYNPAV
jgi:hypothetical protein